MATPVAWMGRAPLLDPPNVFRAAKIIPVFRFLQPLTLAGGFAGLAAFGFAAILLMPGVAGVRKKKSVTMLALFRIGLYLK